MSTNVIKYSIWCSLICFLVAVFFFENAAANSLSKQGQGIPNVIIITLSGVRNVDSIADPEHQYIPHLWNDMLKEGLLYTDLVSVEQEFHMPTLNAIITGENFPLFYSIKTPTIFQYIRKKYAWEANKFWSIGNWQGVQCHYETDGYKEDTYPDYISLGLNISKELEEKLSQQELLFLDAFRKGLKQFSGFSFDNWDTFDELAYRLFKKVVLAFHPKLVYYVMGGPETAHYDSFARYVLSLKRNDEMIYEIWQMIKTDPFYKDNTFLIVGPDHERNAYYRFHDANAHDNPSHVWLYVFGPGVKRGVTVSRPIYHADIFPTVACIMGVETPPSKGKILPEITK
jgi:hypothetical protein